MIRFLDRFNLTIAPEIRGFAASLGIVLSYALIVLTFVGLIGLNNFLVDAWVQGAIEFPAFMGSSFALVASTAYCFITAKALNVESRKTIDEIGLFDKGTSCVRVTSSSGV